MIPELAEAVKDALNAGAFSQAFTAERVYQPRHDLEALGELTVTVVPGPYDRERIGRGQVQKSYTVGVSVQKKVDAETNEQIDPLMALAEEIAEAIGPGFTSNGAGWSATAHDPVYDPEHMAEFQVFTNVILFTFQKL